jgi:hypothetical protein
MKTSPTGIPLKRRSRILPWAMVALWIFQWASHLDARGQAAPVIQDAQKTPAARAEILEVKFKQPPAADSDASRTLQSLVKVRDIGEQYATGGLYLMTHYGDREEIFRKENQRAIDHPMMEESWRYCTVFSTKHENSVIMGRNWDNENVGSIIVSLYLPPRGYASVSLTRAIDMGFPLNVDLKDVVSSPLGSKLLLAPFFAFDGMNEHGLCVAVAGVNQARLKPREGKDYVFVPYLARKMLDKSKTVDDAVNLAEKHIPFDLDKTSLNTHFYIVDSSGRSVVLEYADDQWKKTYNVKAWQVLTNKVISDMPDEKLKMQCWRYKSASEALEKAEGNVDWQAGMRILKNAAQKGTTWSVIYSPTTKELYLSAYQSWNKIYHLGNPFVRPEN